MDGSKGNFRHITKQMKNLCNAIKSSQLLQTLTDLHYHST